MEYRIISWSKAEDLYTLKDGTGKTFFVDLFAGTSFADYPSGTISETTGISREDINQEIIGRVVEIEELNPYCFIASNVKLV